MILVIFLLALATATNADLLNPALLTDSLHGGFSYKPPYEAIKNFNRARYYARKAHDISALHSKIYGLGNGFYGFRYGSNSFKPYFGAFPKYFGSAYQPSGISHQMFYLQSLIPIYGKGLPVNTFYIPKNHGSSYSQNAVYGKGYSYNSQNIFPDNKFSYWNPGSNFQPSPIGYNVPLTPERNPYSPGYQYSYFIKGPNFSKFATQVPNKGYDSIYGTRYGGFPNKVPDWKAKVPGWYSYPMSMTPIAFKGYDSIYGTRYGGFPNQVPESKYIVPEWYSSLMTSDFKGYDSLYGAGNPGVLNKKGTGLYESNFGQVNPAVLSTKGIGLYDSNFGPVGPGLLDIKGTGAYVPNYKPVNPGILNKNLVPEGADFNGPSSGFGNVQPHNLVPSSGADFQVAPGHYELYSNLPKDLLVRSDDDFLSDHPDLTVLGSAADSARAPDASVHVAIKTQILGKEKEVKSLIHKK